MSLEFVKADAAPNAVIILGVARCGYRTAVRLALTFRRAHQEAASDMEGGVAYSAASNF